MRLVTEPEFHQRIKELLADPRFDSVGSVTGPGRSGAIAAVYASHILRVPFITYGGKPPLQHGKLLIIDTAIETGSTMERAVKRYGEQDTLTLACYHEPPRVMFWYESPKPQTYRHEKKMSRDQFELSRK